MKHYLHKLKHEIKHSHLVEALRKNRKFRIAAIAVIVALILITALLIYKTQQNQKQYYVEGEADSDSYTVEYKGVEYEYNTDITSILLIGIDSTGEMKTSKDYGDQARADNIELISFDRRNNCIKVLPVSRDTMTQVRKYTARGYEAGYIKTHIGFAYSFGNGGRASSMNVCDAVSRLLYGVPVYRFVTTNIDSIAYANNLVGGVTVEVPNNDLADRYPELVEGARVKLDDSNVADFLRYRDTSQDGSNNGRMERQEAFIEALIKKLEKMTEDDYIDMWEQIQSDSSLIQTNLTESMFLNLIANTKDYGYKPERDNLKIEGTDKVEDGYDTFHPDIEKLKKLVVETYFEEL